MKQPAEIFYLKEFGDAKVLNHWKAEEISALEAFLEEVWENRKRAGILADWYVAEEEPVNQPLLQINHHRKGINGLQFSARAANYVGIIRFNNCTFHLIPKIIEGKDDLHTLEKSNAHLLWWLSYSKRLHLPKQLTQLQYREADFLEILIHLFSQYTLNELRQGLYQTYQEIEEETTYLKGQLVFSEYVPNYLGRARYQKMYCRYDSFEIDNQFNRIIKFVCQHLRKFTRLKESRKALSQIVWLLDEVSDVHISYHHCDQVVLNQMFSNYKMVLDYCKMFLLNSQSSSSKSEEQAFAFLLPMEKVFEEFVLGFIQKEVNGVKVSGQYQRIFLTEERSILLRPDLHLANSRRTFLADTKYKMLHNNFKVSAGDLYQMVAYAIRHKTPHIYLFYPAWSGLQKDTKEINIRDKFDPANETIKINVHALRVLHPIEKGDMRALKTVFEPLRLVLKHQLETLLDA